MKKLFFILFVTALTCNMAFAFTPARLRDGGLEFAISTIDGMPVFNQAEKSQLIQDNPGGTVIDFTPQQYEINLSTCLIVVIDGKLESGFENYSDWLSCQTKAGLKRKVRKIRQLIDSMSDLPASESKDLKERAGWLKSYFLSLP